MTSLYVERLRAVPFLAQRGAPRVTRHSQPWSQDYSSNLIPSNTIHPISTSVDSCSGFFSTFSQTPKPENRFRREIWRSEMRQNKNPHSEGWGTPTDPETLNRTTECRAFSLHHVQGGQKWSRPGRKLARWLWGVNPALWPQLFWLPGARAAHSTTKVPPNTKNHLLLEEA